MVSSESFSPGIADCLDAKKHGGQVTLGGAPIDDMGGYFLQPTIIKNMSSGMLTTREETFAPVVGLYKFATEEEAIRMANDCEVGLGAFIVTESISRSWRVTEALEVGMEDNLSGRVSVHFSILAISLRKNKSCVLHYRSPPRTLRLLVEEME